MDPFNTRFFRQFPRVLGAVYIFLMSQWAYSSYREGKPLASCLILGIGLVGGGFVVVRDWSNPLDVPTWETAPWKRKVLVVGSGVAVTVILVVSPDRLP